ncbi:MAG: hypothetical protein A2Y10_16990 [Planctomycetes bacterium GWF2_41_51]|nr:MAG: hypothetical protein A2Y10_16990 [Planctomycetes bacterium GWF2_41_51]HBG28073.1 hypothetical protein [Phycisphaerales bacterium]
MKNVYVVSATILMIFCSLATANLTQVNLISQNHQVEGYVDVDENGGVSYNISDTIHVSGSCSSSHGGAHSETSDLKVDGITSGDSWNYWAEAKSWYVFNPISDMLTLSISQSCVWSGSPYRSWFEYYLKDLETSEILSSFYGDDDFIWSTKVGANWSEWNYENQFSVLTDHRYELYLAIHADAMDGTGVTIIADLVPEPASVIMFISGLVLLMKRKRQ